MKSSIQVYGLLIAFMLVVFIVPQLLGWAICYRQCNSVASVATEIIEVNEGINVGNGAQERLHELDEKYDNISLAYSKETVGDGYSVYTVITTKNFKLGILGINYDVHATKKTKRVIY